MDDPRPSRRSFLRTAGLGAASVWIPGRASGYSTADLLPRLEGERLQEGVSKWELETPALCVDLDRLERNLAHLETVVRRNGMRSRPHAKTHKTPAIGKLQMQAGALGLCVAKLGEAEVMLESGIPEILLTTVNLAPSKIQKAMALRRRYPGFIQAVDNPRNARDLSAAAVAAGVTADVVVDVSPGTRTGIQPGAPALALAQLVDGLPGLRLRGMLAYSGPAQHTAGFRERRDFSLSVLAPSVETRDLFRRSGLNTEIYSGGGTGTYNIDHEVGFTDVQAGSYVFMDAQYLAIGGASNAAVYDDFAPSLTLIATVVNSNHPGRATGDAGTKSLTLNQPHPIVVGERGITYQAAADEFGNILYGPDASRTYQAGDRLELIVSHCDPVVNLHDTLYGIRGEKVETIWPIAARGKVR